MALIYLLVGTALLIYVGMPLLIRQTLKINARPHLAPATPAYLPEDVQEYFSTVGPQLAALDFQASDTFTVEQATPGVTSHVHLWLNRAAGQAAAITCIINRNGDRPPVVKRYVEFLTRVPDGVSVTTNNSPELGAFCKTKETDALSVPRLGDVGQLYRLHLWRERQFAASSAPRGLPAAGGELAWFATLFEQSIARQVDTGYLRIADAESAVYQPTIFGAYLMTWGELPPMKPLRRVAEDRRAASQIRQAALASAPSAPPTNAQVITECGDRTPPVRKVA